MKQVEVSLEGVAGHFGWSAIMAGASAASTHPAKTLASSGGVDLVAVKDGSDTSFYLCGQDEQITRILNPGLPTAES